MGLMVHRFYELVEFDNETLGKRNLLVQPQSVIRIFLACQVILPIHQEADGPGKFRWEMGGKKVQWLELFMNLPIWVVVYTILNWGGED